MRHQLNRRELFTNPCISALITQITTLGRESGGRSVEGHSALWHFQTELHRIPQLPSPVARYNAVNRLFGLPHWDFMISLGLLPALSDLVDAQLSDLRSETLRALAGPLVIAPEISPSAIAQVIERWRMVLGVVEPCELDWS